MAESMSLIARLSAMDNGFSATLKGAIGVVDSLGNKIKNGFSFGVLSGIGQQAFSAISNGVQNLVGEINASNVAWKSFEGNMGIIESSGQKLEMSVGDVKKELQSFAEQSIYNSSTMASTYAQLAATGTKNTLKLVEGFAGLAAAAEDPKQAMKTLSQQATQMAAKPTVAWQDFKLVSEQMPGSMAAVARTMGMSLQELTSQIQDGKISTEDFFDAIERTGNSESFQKMATEYKDVGQAMDGLTETIGNKLSPAFEVLSQKGIGAISGIIDEISKIDVESLTNKVSAAVQKIEGFFQKIANTGAFKALKRAVSDVGEAFGHMYSSLSKSGAFDKLATVIGNVIKYLSKAVSAVSNFISKLSPGQFTGGLGAIAGLIGGFKAFNFLKSFNPFGLFKKNAQTAIGETEMAVVEGKSKIAQILNSLGNVIKSVGTAIGTAATGIGTGLKSAFAGLGQMLKVANPVNILALGAAIGVVVAAFALLASQGGGLANIITSLGEAISTIISTAITALTNALLVLAPVIPTIAASLAMLAPLVTALGEAFSLVITAIGTAVSEIATAITPIIQILSTTITEVVSIIADAIVEIVQAIAPYMPSVQSMMECTSRAVQAICEAFTNLVNQVGPIVDSITGLIQQLGDSITEILEGVSDVVSSVGEAISEVVSTIGDSITKVVDSISGGFTSVLEAVADVIESIGTAAKDAGEGFKSVAEGIEIIAGLSILDVAEALSAVAIGLTEISATGGGLSEAAAGMEGILSAIMMSVVGVTALVVALQLMSQAATTMATGISAAALGLTVFGAQAAQAAADMGTVGDSAADAAAGVQAFGNGALLVTVSVIAFSVSAQGAVSGIRAMASALEAGRSGMKSIAVGAKSAQASAENLSGSVVDAGNKLETLGSVAKSALSKVELQFRSLAKSAKTAGKEVGAGFTQAMQSGLSAAPSVAVMAVNLVAAALSAGRASAYNAGAYISQGFAAGMLSCLGVIQSAAARMAAAADAAIRAKAKIASPSKAAAKLGRYYGEGYAIGISDMEKKVWDAAEKLVSLPSVATPDLALSYGGEMSAEYDYYRDAEYTIVVPLAIDGREFARSTASYTQAELDRKQARDSRKHGRV